MPFIMKKCRVNRGYLGEEGTLKDTAIKLPIARRNYCSVLWRKLLNIQVIFFPSSLFSPYIFQHCLLHSYLSHLLHCPHQSNSSFFFLIELSHFLPTPILVICLKPPSHSQWSCWFLNVSCLASSLGPCPNLGKLSWAVLNPVTVMWLRPFFTGWSLTFAYWIRNQTWIWAMKGICLHFFSNIWNMNHIILHVKRIFSYSAP